MKFGVFDHVDDDGQPLADHLESRLRMVEAYDRCGFHCYHVAEHHGTPLGHAPSPSVYLSSVAQRTKRLLFGPMVYLLPIYHPLRLIEEVAMLDALSGGRFQLGVGRGVSPIEMGFYGLDMEEHRERYDEALEILLKGLSNDSLSHNGRFHQFDNVPMELRPIQRPHPPLWYGATSPESIAWAARERVNIITLALGERVKQVTGQYREEYAASGGDPAQIPLMGISRHIVVADSESEAMNMARPAYRKWRASLARLWEERGTGFPLAGIYPDEWDDAQASGHGIAGTLDQVREFVRREIEYGGMNYFVSWFAFGDLTVEQVTRSVELFASEVMPHFAD